MIDLVGLVLGMRQQLLQLSDVLPRLAEVQGPEIVVEIVIDEVLDMEAGTLSMLK